MSNTDAQVPDKALNDDTERHTRSRGRGRRNFGRRGGRPYGRGRGRRFQTRYCSNCNLPGHTARDCPRGKICRKCFEEGYFFYY